MPTQLHETAILGTSCCAGYSVVQGPKTTMARPHPAVWRLVHGCAVVYTLMLVWMLLQTVDDARQFLKARGSLHLGVWWTCMQ